MGDQYALDAEQRKEREIGQWAVSFPPVKFGRIPRYAVDQAFLEFKALVLDKMREAGCLRLGD